VADGEGELVVLGEHRGVVDAPAAISGRDGARQASRADLSEHADPQDSRRPRDHQALALQAAHVPGVAGVFVALQMPDKASPFAAAEGPADRSVPALGQAGAGVLEEGVVQCRVGVLHQDQGVVGEGLEQDFQSLVEGAGLLVDVADGFADLSPGIQCYARRLVRAVVHDDDDPDRGSGLVLQVLHRPPDARCLVVSRQEGDDLSHPAQYGLPGRGGHANSPDGLRRAVRTLARRTPAQGCTRHGGRRHVMRALRKHGFCRHGSRSTWCGGSQVLGRMTPDHTET